MGDRRFPPTSRGRFSEPLHTPCVYRTKSTDEKSKESCIFHLLIFLHIRIRRGYVRMLFNI